METGVWEGVWENTCTWVGVYFCLHSYPMVNLKYREKGGKHKTLQHMDSLMLLTLKRASERISFTAGISIQTHATYEET